MSRNSQTPSPAQRFAAAVLRHEYPVLTEFAATLPFELDPFQVDACRAVERGDNVLVCAPTGAGKTVVGEFAVARALDLGGTCFYTTPIKALSNQKYADLVAARGIDSVGLLTGDTTVNPHAPIVVMTTEVLRNMLYAGSTDLAGLSAVVLDEVHYLADRFRGSVWEEVILHLDASVSVIGLSATVSNAEEFGDWIRTVRGHTTVVVDETRPVPLWQHMMVGGTLMDLYAEQAGRHGAPAERQVNPAVTRAIRQVEAAAPALAEGRNRRTGRGGPRWRPTPRSVVVARLDNAGLLPAIVFIFSRAGCDAAAQQCVHAGVRLTDPAERELIDAIIDRHVTGLPTADLDVLGYQQWRYAWQCGIAAHHAGLLPAFKETVEELFVRGLVKVVFATETLSLGINMPARTVLLERLVKYDGESHADVTPAEYTQLTGRAGRRGIDIEGHAVVMWAPGVDPAAVAGLAATRTFPLRSSFRPTYNMVVNLVDRLGRSAARSLLEQSFAQFQADRELVGTARQADRTEAQIAALDEQLICEFGDATEYAELCQRLTEAEKARSRSRASARRETAVADLAVLRPGDVILVPTGRRRGLAVVLDSRPDHAGSIRPLVATEQRWAGRLDPGLFTGPVPVLGRVRLSKRVEHWKPAVRRDLAATLAASGITAPRRSGRRDAAEPADRDLALLHRAVRSHGVHHCPDRQGHVAVARTRVQLLARVTEMRRHIDTARGSMSRTLDKIVTLLTDQGYLADDAATGSGRILQRVWSESDLIAAECLRRGLWRALSAADLAAAVSGLVFESRRDGRVGARAVMGSAREAAMAMEDCWREITAAEQQQHLPTTRAPDFGFAGAAAAWAAGSTLGQALDRAAEIGDELSAGDFVRWCRQLIDLLDQLRAAAPVEMIPHAAQAVAAIRRGVVALGIG